jgi:hypothetical protein
LVDEEHPQAEEFQEMTTDLQQRWNELHDAMDDRKNRLELSEVAQQVNAECFSLLYSSIGIAK